jgi:hypothetical protein
MKREGAEASRDIYDHYLEELRILRSGRIENRKFLFDLYKISIDEYRYQVSLNWDREKFFLVSAITVIGAACVMMRFVSDPVSATIVPMLFMLSAFLGLLGLDAQRVGKKYYRATLDHMYDAWSLLNESNRFARNHEVFDVPAFKTTRGMKSRAETGFGVKSGDVTPGSFSSQLRKFFILVTIVGSIGAVISAAYLLIRYRVFDFVLRLAS